MNWHLTVQLCSVAFRTKKGFSKTNPDGSSKQTIRRCQTLGKSAEGVGGEISHLVNVLNNTIWFKYVGYRAEPICEDS